MATSLKITREPGPGERLISQLARLPLRSKEEEAFIGEQIRAARLALIAECSKCRPLIDHITRPNNKKGTKSYRDICLRLRTLSEAGHHEEFSQMMIDHKNLTTQKFNRCPCNPVTIGPIWERVCQGRCGHCEQIPVLLDQLNTLAWDLVARYSRLVIHSTNRFGDFHEVDGRDDVIQNDLMNLHKAAIWFDPTLARFSTIADWHLRASAQKQRRRSLTQRLGGRLKLTSNWVRVNNRNNEHATQTDMLDFVSFQPGDTIPVSAGQSHVERIEQTADVAKMLESCTPRERMVIERRFGLNGYVTQSLDQIGRELSITRERVRQIETAAIRVMRRNL